MQCSVSDRWETGPPIEKFRSLAKLSCARYLFLEQIAHFLDGVLTFFSKAGVPIQRFSESTHVGALNKACKMMKFKKKLNSFSSSVHNKAEILQFLLKIAEEQAQFSYLITIQCMYLHNVSTAGCCVDQHRGQQLLSLRDLRAAAGAGPGRGQDQQVLHPQKQQVTRHNVC